MSVASRRPLRLGRRRRGRARPRRRSHRLDEPLVEPHTRRLGDHAGAARGSLGAGAVAVAPVGAEDQVVGGDDRPAVRSAEAGQPANVDQVGVDERVAAPHLPTDQRRTDGIDACGVLDRRERRAVEGGGQSSRHGPFQHRCGRRSASTSVDDLHPGRAVEDERQTVERLLVATHQREEFVGVETGWRRGHQVVLAGDDPAVLVDAGLIDAAEFVAPVRRRRSARRRPPRRGRCRGRWRSRGRGPACGRS